MERSRAAGASDAALERLSDFATELHKLGALRSEHDLVYPATASAGQDSRLDPSDDSTPLPQGATPHA